MTTNLKYNIHQNLKEVKLKKIKKSISEIKNLAGTFQLLNDKTFQISPDVQLKIFQRKKETKNKPPDYLVCFKNNKWACYVSSLYFIGQDKGLTRYKFDFQGKDYYLDLDAGKGQAKIFELEQELKIAGVEIKEGNLPLEKRVELLQKAGYSIEAETLRKAETGQK